MPTVADACLLSVEAVLHIARSVFSAYRESKSNLLAYSVWTAASVFVLHLQTLAGIERQHNEEQKHLL